MQLALQLHNQPQKNSTASYRSGYTDFSHSPPPPTPIFDTAQAQQSVIRSQLIAAIEQQPQLVSFVLTHTPTLLFNTHIAIVDLSWKYVCTYLEKMSLENTSCVRKNQAPISYPVHAYLSCLLLRENCRCDHQDITRGANLVP